MATFGMLDDDGGILQAKLDIEENAIVLHSRSGSRADASPRNPDYAAALELVLKRIHAAGLSVQSAWVDSRNVQHLEMSERTILTDKEFAAGHSTALALMKARIAEVGRAPGATGAGNATKRIKLLIAGTRSETELMNAIGAVPESAENGSSSRMPASELNKVQSHHIWRSVQRLLDGSLNHPFGESTDFDVIADGGIRLPPKAVFGIAASEALGFEVRPKHFSGGLGTPCFRALEDAGYEIVRKGETSSRTSLPSDDGGEWREGGQKLVTHLRGERAPGLSAAKKASFIEKHAILFCENCGLKPREIDPVHGDACIEVHHARVMVSEMDADHVTTLEDLQCLCANCHRILHSRLRAG
jgi:hypothetical protein